MTMVDGRAYPLFALLFGYGIVQLLRRQTLAGVDPPTVRRLIRRRGWWMVGIGFAHAALLFAGDVVGAYGLLGVACAGLIIGGSDRLLLAVAGLGLLPLAVLGAGQGAPVPGEVVAYWPSMGTTDPLRAAGLRIAEWSMLTPFTVLMMASAVLLGAWAARRGVLDDPARHTHLLARGAAFGLPLAVVGGLPMALMSASVWHNPSLGAGLLAGTVHTVTGYAGGIGYACLAGLIAIRLQARRGRVVGALTACGQRSLTCYLAQSVVFVAVLAAYGGGLGDRIGVAAAALLAVVTWATTVVLADVMARRGNRGPFEVLLRRLSYPR
jgi:uncharacterized membrane protein YeiB